MLAPRADVPGGKGDALWKSLFVTKGDIIVFVVNATLTQFKKESDDSDYHLVLSDAAGKTMIAEIPHPDCVASSSPFLTSITNARAAFNAVAPDAQAA